MTTKPGSVIHLDGIDYLVVIDHIDIENRTASVLFINTHNWIAVRSCIAKQLANGCIDIGQPHTIVGRCLVEKVKGKT